MQVVMHRYILLFPSACIPLYACINISIMFFVIFHCCVHVSNVQMHGKVARLKQQGSVDCMDAPISHISISNVRLGKAVRFPRTSYPTKENVLKL